MKHPKFGSNILYLTKYLSTLQVGLSEKATVRFTEFIDVAEAVKDGLIDFELTEEIEADILDVFTVFDLREVRLG